MSRSLVRRVVKLGSEDQSEDVHRALRALWDDGAAPAGWAGDRARALWQESESLPYPDETWRRVWCILQATGKSLTELIAEAGEAEGPDEIPDSGAPPMPLPHWLRDVDADDEPTS